MPFMQSQVPNSQPRLPVKDLAALIAENLRLKEELSRQLGAQHVGRRVGVLAVVLAVASSSDVFGLGG